MHSIHRDRINRQVHEQHHSSIASRVYVALAFIGLLSFAIFQHFSITSLRKEIAALSTPPTLPSPPASHVSTTKSTFLSPPRYPATLQSRKSESTSSLNENNDILGTFSLSAPAPPNLPALKISEEEEAKIKRSDSGVTYGGKRDPPHLGGFTERDNHTISQTLFNYIVGPLAVKSIIDVGCGRGFSTDHFMRQGAKVLCVEGSHDAVQQSLLPKEVIVEHDFTRGPWWPTETFDAAWSTEFLEHVGRQYMRNYMPIFKKAAIVFVTSSAFGGWHHVEVHEEMWWRGRFISNGFIFSQEMTDMVHAIAMTDPDKSKATNGQLLKARLLVFINPAVAGLPRHDHLFGGHGCFKGENDNRDGGTPCLGQDALPPKYQSLLNCIKKRKDNNILWIDVPWECEPNPTAEKSKL